MIIRKILKKVIYDIIYRRNPKQFYGSFIRGGLPFWLRWIYSISCYKDVLQIVGLSIRVKPKKSYDKGKLDEFEERENIEKFKRDGIILLKDYFLKEADHIIKSNKEFFEKSIVRMGAYDRDTNILVDQQILENVILDASVLRIIASYYGSQPYLRCSPGIFNTSPDYSDQTSREKFENGDLNKNLEFADTWHNDTPYLVQMHILLNDIGMDDPHMVFAKGSHKDNFGLMKFLASEEFVTDNYEVVHCVGSKGSMYLFDGSRGLHRMYSSMKSRRSSFHLSFTRGNHILNDYYKLNLGNDIDFNKFDPCRKEALKYVFDKI